MPRTHPHRPPFRQPVIDLGALDPLAQGSGSGRSSAARPPVRAAGCRRPPGRPVPKAAELGWQGRVRKVVDPERCFGPRTVTESQRDSQQRV